MARRNIKIFAIDTKAASAFKPIVGIKQSDMILVDTPDAADIIMGGLTSRFNAQTVRPGKLHVVWTNEPGEYHRGIMLRPFLPELLGDQPLHILNAHNMMVYTDNYFYAPRAGPLPMLAGEGDLNVAYADKMVTFAAVYRRRSSPAMRRVTLIPKRQKIAIDMHAAGRMRIIGPDWPLDMAEADTRRGGDRHGDKLRFLQTGNFNLCYENTLADYYVTEKIWEAIKGGCLPIYHANSTIHHSFPIDSFIDGALFESTEALMGFIDAMPIEEYIRRVNACRTAYNHAIAGGMNPASKRRTRRRLYEFLRSIVPPADNAEMD